MLVSIGIVEASRNRFGHKAAGIVRRTGANITNLKLGDRVILISDYTFTTRRIVSENLYKEIPSGLSFEDTATMPCVFSISIYSIFNIGDLKKG
jgi:NADPH:quinone reductase-like Zn-dependent oxidoreductase